MTTGGLECAYRCEGSNCGEQCQGGQLDISEARQSVPTGERCGSSCDGETCAKQPLDLRVAFNYAFGRQLFVSPFDEAVPGAMVRSAAQSARAALAHNGVRGASALSGPGASVGGQFWEILVRCRDQKEEPTAVSAIAFTHWS